MLIFPGQFLPGDTMEIENSAVIGIQFVKTRIDKVRAGMGKECTLTTHYVNVCGYGNVLKPGLNDI